MCLKERFLTLMTDLNQGEGQFLTLMTDLNQGEGHGHQPIHRPANRGDLLQHSSARFCDR